MNWHPLLALSSVIQATLAQTGTITGTVTVGTSPSGAATTAATVAATTAATVAATTAATVAATVAATAAATSAATTAAATVAGATAAATAAATTAASTVTATLATTTTVGVTETPAIVPTIAPVAATSTSSGLTDYLAQPSGLGPFSITFLVLCVALLGVGAYFYFVGKDRWRKTNSVNYRVAGNWSIIAMIFGAVGAFFALLRVAGLLNERYWLYLVGVALLLVAAYAVYFFTQQYPKQMAAWVKRQGPKGTRTTTVRARTAQPGPRSGTATPDADAPPVAKGSAGNPRGTSPRGERRRTKR